MPRYEPPDTRFWRFVDRAGVDDCWEWMGSRTTKGYGGFSGEGRVHLLAHRFSYQLTKGPIPEGYQIDHLCNNPGCVNPRHLEAVTPHENNARSSSVTAQKGRQTHCVNGHEFDAENTYIRPDGKGRECRACKALRSKRAKELARG